MAEAEPGLGAASPPSLPRAVLRVLLPFAAGYYLAYLFRTVGAVISGRLVATLHLAPAQLGLLTSSYFLAFAVAQLPVGAALDRYGPRRVQAVLLPLAAAGAALFALSHNLALLALSRAMIGVGSAGALMAGLKALTLWFPRERLALANGLLIMLGALGAVTATAPAEMLLRAVDWREFYGLLALAAASSAAMLLLVLPGWKPEAAGLRPKIGLLGIYQDRRFWRLAPLSTCCIGTSFAMQGLWAAPWLSDVARLGRQGVVGALFTMALALCAGALGLGVAADQLRRRGIRPRDLLAVIAALSITAQAALALRLPVLPLLPWIVVAVAGSATVLSYAALAEMFPREIAGRANCALNVLHIGGAFAIQCGIGVVIGCWGADSAGHSPAIAYAVAFGLNLLPQGAALAWFLIAPVMTGNTGAALAMEEA